MAARILDGRAAAAAMLRALKPRILELDPKLVIVQVGEDPASASYIRQKLRSCRDVGMRSEHAHLSAQETPEVLLALIGELNGARDVAGFIVQLPLPSPLDHRAPQILRAIAPEKDVDGFGALNLGNTVLGAATEYLPPATPAGVIALLEHEGIPVAGKHAVVVGRSNHVGKPLAIMLLNRAATVTVCHSRTGDLGAMTRQADILCTAVGSPRLITADMVKPGAVVVDIGINKTAEGLCGDVDFHAVREVASAITPVPGGVGPMTVAALIQNCVRAKERQLGRSPAP